MRVTRGSFAHGLDRAGVSLGIDDHRPELEGGEHPAVLADTLLREEHRTAVLELDRRGDQRGNRREHDQARAPTPAMSNSRFMRRPPLPRAPARARRPGDRARTTRMPARARAPIASRSLRLSASAIDRRRQRCRVAGRHEHAAAMPLGQRRHLASTARPPRCRAGRRPGSDTACSARCSRPGRASARPGTRRSLHRSSAADRAAGTGGSARCRGRASRAAALERPRGRLPSPMNRITMSVRGLQRSRPRRSPRRGSATARCCRRAAPRIDRSSPCARRELVVLRRRHDRRACRPSCG